MVQVAYFRGARRHRRRRRAPRRKTRLTQRGGAIVVPATWAATRFLLRGKKRPKPQRGGAVLTGLVASTLARRYLKRKLKGR